MKLTFLVLSFLFSFSALAASGAGAMTLVLEQPEVERHEAEMNRLGYTLTNVKDVFASRGMVPRCPCTSLDVTYSKVSGGEATEKVFNIYSQGFGTNQMVTIKPTK